MRTLAYRQAPQRRASGFSLVELMVGIGIGLMSTVVIATILANSEQKKRTNSSGSDAQIAGTLALHDMERNLRSAGYGLTTDIGGLGCTLAANYGGAAAPGAPAKLAPVLITAGAAGAAPTVQLVRARGQGFSLPVPVMAPLFDPAGSGSVTNTVVVQSTVGLQANDLLAAVQGPADPATGVGTCTVFQASALAADGLGITRNVDAGWNGLGDLGALTALNYVISLGDLEALSYAVAPQSTGSGVYQLNLTTYSLASRTSTVRNVQNGVVDFRAFYGLDSDGDGVVDSYSVTTPTTANGWRALRSIRLAVLARSTQYEKEEVTTVAPQWDVGTAATVTGATTCGDSKCISMRANLGDDAATEWKHYRYKLFDMVVPLHNQLWHSD